MDPISPLSSPQSNLSFPIHKKKDSLPVPPFFQGKEKSTRFTKKIISPLSETSSKLLKKQAKEIDFQLKLFEEELETYLLSGEGKSFNDWCQNHGSDLVRVILQTNRVDHAEIEMANPLKKIYESAGMVDDMVATPIRMIDQIIEVHPSEKIAEIHEYIKKTAYGAEFLYTAVATVGGVVGYFLRKKMVASVEAEIQKMKALSGPKNKAIAFLEKWVSDQKRELKEGFYSLFAQAVLYAPKGTTLIWSLIQTIPDSASAGLSTATGIVDIAKKTWEVRKEVANQKILLKWEEGWKDLAAKILRKKAERAKRATSKADVVKEEKKETRGALIRNALRTFETLKLQFEGQLRSFKTTKAKFDQFFSTLAIVSLVGFKILAVTASIAIPVALVATVGLVPFLLATALSLAGLIYLHQKKPHLFKELICAVELRASLFQIPLSIQKWRLESKKLNQVLMAKKLEAAASETLFLLSKGLAPKGKEQELVEKIKQWKAMKHDIKQLEKKVEFWQKKISFLDNRLTHACALDFFEKYSLSKNNPISQLASHLVESNSLDEETKNVLKLRFAINIDFIFSKTTDSSVRKKMIMEALLSYFSKTDETMIQYIEKQSKIA